MFTPIFHLKPKTKRLYKYRKNIRFETLHGRKITNCRLSTYCNILSPAMGFVCLAILRNIVLHILPKKLEQKITVSINKGFQ